MKTQPATGETYPKSDLFNKADANSSWMVEDSFPRALREYNEMVDDYNSLR
ncbi:DUF3829 domain-containing protein [Escherichia coli]|uniref:DUF3829 domain-containing protein n=1 Tax=Escherichia coli TaxID=562 RepID=UPI0038602C3E